MKKLIVFVGSYFNHRANGFGRRKSLAMALDYARVLA